MVPRALLLALVATVVTVPLGVLLALGLDRCGGRVPSTANFAVLLASLAMLMGLAWPGWWIWAALIFMIGQSYAEPLDQIGGAMDGARSGESHVFPGPGGLRLIGFEALERVGERSGPAGGTQAHVDFVEIAFVGESSERRHDSGAEAGVVLDRG